MSNELKPCPKGCDSFIDVGTREIDIGWWSAIVRCADCGIELRRGAQSEKEALEKAIEAWNTRAERTCHPVRRSGKSFSAEEKKTTLDACCSECRGFLGEAWEVFECECDLFCSGCGAKVVE